MKEALKEFNRQYKEQEIKKLVGEMNARINNLIILKSESAKLNNLQRFVLIADSVKKLSYYRENDILELVKSFGLLKYTPKVFISYDNFFDTLDEYQDKMEYLYPYQLIWGFYELYSSSVIKEKMALDFNINLLDLATKVNRQQSNLSFPEVFKDNIGEIKKIAKFVKQEIPDYKLPISDKNTVNSVMHINQYSHKNDLYNLYYSLLDFNIDAKVINVHEPDFKVEFYDLLEILLRDKTLLNNNHDTRVQYGKDKNNRRFKIKWVERMILS